MRLLTLLIVLFGFFSCENTPENTTSLSENTVSSPENTTMQMDSTDLLYIGTYTRKEGHVDGKADGIYIAEVQTKTGELTILDTIKNSINPSYLTVHPNRKYLYAVNELADGTEAYVGTVSAYLLDENGRLDKALNTVNAQGDAPCHVSVDATGEYVLVASYMGTISVFPIQADGSLGEASDSVKHELANPPGGRQEAAHAHMLVSGIDNKSVFAVDLGTDEVIHYQLVSGKLERVAVTPLKAGAGPRHLVFNAQHKLVYVLNELNKTIEVFRYTKADEPFNRLQIISTFKQTVTEGDLSPAATKVHPNGKFLYASNRGIGGCTSNNIALFQIHSETGLLTLKMTEETGGLVPRDFEITPDGKLLLVAHQNSSTVTVMSIDEETGLLRKTDVVNNIATPVCLTF